MLFDYSYNNNSHTDGHNVMIIVSTGNYVMLLIAMAHT